MGMGTDGLVSSTQVEKRGRRSGAEAKTEGWVFWWGGVE